MIYYGPEFVEQKIGERFFKSGLVENSWKRICPASNLESVRNSIFGNVHPGVNVNLNENGLAVLQWTTYENTEKEPLILRGTQILNLAKSFNEDGFNWTINEQWLCDTLTKTTVYKSSISNILFNYNGVLNKYMKKRKISGIPKSIYPVHTNLQITWYVDTVNISRRNFGLWDEVDITIANIPTY
jgi:hypothetical protein